VHGRSVSLPDLAPFAGLIFLIVGFYALTSRFKGPELGVVPNDQLPYSVTHACIPENMEAVVSLGTTNQLSFAVTHPETQAAAIRQVASRHGITFTPAQSAELKTLSFLRTDVENLPKLLSLPMYQRNRPAELSKLSPLSEQQLLECVVAAKTSAATLTHKPVYISFKVDSEVKTPQIERLIALLQTKGINRFNLQTQYK